jgi:hypothetical protein
MLIMQFWNDRRLLNISKDALKNLFLLVILKSREPSSWQLTSVGEE